MVVADLFEANFTEDELQTLYYLIHDKSHTLSLSSKNESMESIFRKSARTCKKPLYRGVKSEKELEKYIKGKEMGQYTSYSESKKAAAVFGRVIMLEPPAKGFCYWKFLVDDFNKIKKKDPDEFDAIDGNHLIELAKTELEWIMPFNLKLHLVDEDKLIFKVEA